MLWNSKGKTTDTHTHTHTHTATVHGYIRAKESPAEWCVGFEYGVNLSGNSKVYKVTPWWWDCQWYTEDNW